MKHILLWLAVLVLFTASAMADGLPIDFTGGSAPLESGLTDNSYEDSTISVHIETGRTDGCDYWIADIVIAHPSQIRTASAGGFESNMVMDGERMAKRMNAILAINGDFYSSSEKKGRGYVIRQGELYLDNLDEDNHYGSILMDILLIDEDGDFHVLYRPENGSIRGTVEGKKIINAFSFGPVLVDHGEAVTSFNGSDRYIDMAADKKRQRMCICQVEPLHYKAICCAAPARGSAGMTLRQFADFVAQQGVWIAYNLDGGDSTMLIFNGRKQNDVRNRSTRKLLDIIYFASAEGMN